MTDDHLAQAIANVHAELRSHMESETGTIRDLADEVHDSHAILLELSRELPGLRAQANGLDVRVRKLEMNGHGAAPLARHPHPSAVDLELARYGADETPAGGIRIEQAMWATIVASKRDADAAREEMEGAISDLRIQVEAGEEDRQREKSRREGAELERQRVEAESSARIKRLAAVTAAMAPAAVGVWEAVKWLLVFFGHH